MLAAALEQRDGVRQGRGENGRHGERDGPGTPGQSGYESATNDPRRRSRQHRARTDLLERQLTEDFPEPFEALFEERFERFERRVARRDAGAARRDHGVG